MDQKYQELIKKLGVGNVKLDEPMAEHTTFKIGGLADLFIETENEEELIRVLGVVRDLGIPYFILGGGSNILVGDKGFRGIVIKVQSSKCKVQSYPAAGGTKCKIYAEAGVLLRILLDECMKNSLTGLEFMAGIPGTVGGAIRGNAGAWQKNIGDFVMKVKTLRRDGQVGWIEKEDCQFGYRESCFKKSGEIVLAAEFGVERGDRGRTEEKIREYLSKREGQPKESSAGCIFVNPKPRSAGELIDQCGLKGRQTGGAKISEKHANFIINVGGAKAAEVVQLINLARDKVKEKFSVELKEEIVRIGEF